MTRPAFVSHVMSLRPWAAPLALSVAVHGAVAAGALGLLGTVEPPRPEAVIPVELVLAAAPAGDGKPSEKSGIARPDASAAEPASIPPPAAPEPQAKATAAPTPDAPSEAAAEPPPQDAAALPAPVPRRKPAPPAAFAARDPVGSLVERAATKAPEAVTTRSAETESVSLALPKKESGQPHLKSCRPGQAAEGRASRDLTPHGAAPDPGSRPSGSCPGRQNSFEQPSAISLSNEEEGGKLPAPQHATRSGAGAPLVPPGWDVSGLANKPPVYPVAARRRGVEGRVVLRVRVSASGAAETVAVATSSGHALLDEAARRAVARWRFVPGRIAGVPVAAAVDVPIVFRLKE